MQLKVRMRSGKLELIFFSPNDKCLSTCLITQSIGQNITPISAAVAIQLLNVVYIPGKDLFCGSCPNFS